MFVFTIPFFQILQSLTLLQMDISTIHQDALQGTELSYIKVRNCIFHGNVSFSWLYAPTVGLSSMDIRQLTRESFHGVLHLKYLTLSNLNLTTINKQAFSNIQSLRKIYISECPLVTLDSTGDISSLSGLFITGASFQTLKYEAVLGLHSLKYLTIKKGSLENIFPDIINNTNNSLQLWTGNANSSKTMSCNMYVQTTKYGLHNITRIDLSQNAIQFIFPGVLCYFSSLYYLYLHNNRIRDLHVHSFLGIRNLETLYLNSNEIAFLRQGIFSSLPNLQILNLARNNIKCVDSDVFSALYSFTQNSSTYRPATIQHFNLVGNHIKILNKHAFKNLVSLTSLQMDHNYIGSLEAGTFYGLNDLEILYMNYNKITHIHGGVLTSLVMLHSLEVKHNKIQYLNPKAFSNCTRLGRLQLDHNEIRELHPDLLTGLIHLKTLSFYANKIRSIQLDTFTSNKRLSYVNLASNRIQTIDSGTFLPLPSLELLHLQNNQIHSLTKDIFFVSRYVNMYDNPIKCSCDLFWMKNMTKEGVSWYLPFCNVSLKLTIFDYLKAFCCENRSGLCKTKRPSLPLIQRYKHMNTIIFTGTMLFVTVVVIVVLLIRRHKKMKAKNG